jgi:hypothetical protein
MRHCCLLLSVLLLSFAAKAETVTGTLKFQDSAQSKVRKTPLGTFLETAEKYSSKHTVILNVPGASPANFNGDTELTFKLEDAASSGTDYDLTIKFSEDPKYVAGAKSVKIVKNAIGGVVGKAVLGIIQVKFGKDIIAITIDDKVRPAYAQEYLNFSIKGANNYPPGPGTFSRTVKGTVTLGTLSATIDNVTYTNKFNNKSKDYNGQTLWAGTAKGKTE